MTSRASQSEGGIVSAADLVESGSITAEKRVPSRRRGRAARRGRRLAASRRVGYELEGHTVFGLTRDIGRDGLFIRTSRLLPEGSTHEFSITLDSDQEPVRIAAKVVRTVPEGKEAGMALAFDENQSYAAAIERIRRYAIETLRSEIEKQLQVNARNVRALRDLGQLFQEDGDSENAIATYRTLLTVDPATADAYVWLASLLSRKARAVGDAKLYQEARILLETGEALVIGSDELGEERAQIRRLLAEHAMEPRLREQAQKEAIAEALARHERELKQMEAELAAKEASLVAAKTALAERQRHQAENEAAWKKQCEAADAELERRVTALEEKERELAAKREQHLHEADTRVVGLSPEQARVVKAQRELSQAEEKVEAEKRELDKAHHQLQQDKDTLLAERARLDALNAQTQSRITELAQQRTIFVGRQREVDAERAAVTKSRRDFDNERIRPDDKSDTSIITRKQTANPLSGDARGGTAGVSPKSSTALRPRRGLWLIGISSAAAVAVVALGITVLRHNASKRVENIILVSQPPALAASQPKVDEAPPPPVDTTTPSVAVEPASVVAVPVPKPMARSKTTAAPATRSTPSATASKRAAAHPQSGGERLSDLFANDEDVIRVDTPNATDLTVRAVASAARRRTNELSSCLREAFERKELSAGAYTLSLRWQVQADGKVTDTRVNGPDSVRNPTTTQCVLRVMDAWTFQTSGVAVKMTNVSIGPLRVP